jgi:hypothetical protein
VRLYAEAARVSNPFCSPQESFSQVVRYLTFFRPSSGGEYANPVVLTSNYMPLHLHKKDGGVRGRTFLASRNLCNSKESGPPSFLVSAF